ncbi:glycosyltransferase family 2 protein [Micromonospora sp. NBC_01813]|uniref:glycosyltransferase family 2 protein n=1 Tax=Micromonospora sp. NBC_01813 TaxID=2975988 RepID=UPI002DDA8355|nr:glycosyltransferase family 2 protein [Micromonospora sp. NBC_01813]WSA07487.1 glycosyltransferase family 2 protein [Micromonospora sp. NBC_01813]
MRQHAGTDSPAPVGTAVTWRLTGLPAPHPAERLGRAVGLRVLRIPGTGRALVLAGSVDRLRDLTFRPAAAAPVRAVTVVVAWWRPPRRGWAGTVGLLPGLRRHRVGLPRLRRGAATVRIALTTPVPLRDAVRAALPALDGSRPLPSPGSPDVTATRADLAYLPANATIITATAGGELAARDEIRAHDLVLAGPGSGDPLPAAVAGRPEQAGRPYGTVLVGSGHTVAGPDGRDLVLIDAERINPRGRLMAAYRPQAPEVMLEFARDRSGGGFRGGPASGLTLRGALAGPGLDAAAVAALRHVRAVHCRLVPGEHPAQTAGLLVQLAATGVVLHAPLLPPAVADLLDPKLRALVSEPPPTAETDAAPDDPAGAALADAALAGAGAALATEARSVRQRRAALRGHAAGLRLPGLATGGLPQLGQPPSVSAILITRRPELVAPALAAITAQTYPEMEIILGLHGIDLPEAARVALSECGRPFEVVHLAESVDFGAALGAATRRARGTLVTKFDDDDSYGVEHVWDLVLARHYSGATLVGKGAELVYLESQGVLLRRRSGISEAYGDVVAGGTMLLAKGDLEAVGGWRPVPRSVDLGLIERLRAAGATIYRTHSLGYVYHRRPAGHTWDPGEAYFVDSAYARWPGVPPDAMADEVRPPSTAAASDAAGAAARPAGRPPS